MCDETTEAESAVFLLDRRDGIGAGAALMLSLVGCSREPSAERGAPTSHAPAPKAPGSAPAPKASMSAPAAAAKLVDTAGRMVDVPMAEGTADAFFVAPREGKHPGVIIWPDIAGVRDAFKTMATRLASSGYAVLLVNHYYRSAKLPIFATFSEWRTKEGQAKVATLKEPLTNERITEDGAAFIKWLDAQSELDTTKKLGALGYCMTGSYTFRVGAAAPQRVGVMASFHGGGLVTDDADSPHKLLGKTRAAALVCIAQNDDARQPEAKQVLRATADAAQIPAAIEVYPAPHGFTVPDSPSYTQAEAERAWAALLETLRKHL
jgi:carboxymethylenebutenolidase